MKTFLSIITIMAVFTAFIFAQLTEKHQMENKALKAQISVQQGYLDSYCPQVTE